MLLSLLLGQLSCISFPRHEEEFLQSNVGSVLYIVVLGQDCAARYQLLNCLLGERLLPLGPEAGEACDGVQGTSCKRRKLCFTHGRQTRLSLALPGQYELVHQLAAHCGRGDTVPREDLEIQEECEDPAHRLAELEITLHHPLLQVHLHLHMRGGFRWWESFVMYLQCKPTGEMVKGPFYLLVCSLTLQY